jgi:hypothetical protein
MWAFYKVRRLTDVSELYDWSDFDWSTAHILLDAGSDLVPFTASVSTSESDRRDLNMQPSLTVNCDLREDKRSLGRLRTSPTQTP